LSQGDIPGMRNSAQTNAFTSQTPPPGISWPAAMPTRFEWLTKLQAARSAGPGIRYLNQAKRTFFAIGQVLD
jgi:hypothetical protein